MLNSTFSHIQCFVHNKYITDLPVYLSSSWRACRLFDTTTSIAFDVHPFIVVFGIGVLSTMYNYWTTEGVHTKIARKFPNKAKPHSSTTKTYPVQNSWNCGTMPTEKPLAGQNWYRENIKSFLCTQQKTNVGGIKFK